MNGYKVIVIDGNTLKTNELGPFNNSQAKSIYKCFRAELPEKDGYEVKIMEVLDCQ